MALLIMLKSDIEKNVENLILLRFSGKSKHFLRREIINEVDKEYVRLFCSTKLMHYINNQLNAFVLSFYTILKLKV